MEIDKNHIIGMFRQYVHTFDGVHKGVLLKYEHSLRVSSYSQRIATSLSLSPFDIQLAWLIGILHDIGRFEQLKEFHTFIDHKSMDHAAYGVDYLFSKGHIRDFLTDDSCDDVIAAAIANHNAYTIEPDLSPRQNLFAKIIRDADKVDIFSIYLRNLQGGHNVWNVGMSNLKFQSISDAVMHQARQSISVRTRDKKTFMDYYAGMLCMYFDIQFDKTRQLVWENGDLATLLAFHSRNDDTEQKLAEIRTLICNFK